MPEKVPEQLFCPKCDVVLQLHEGPDSCELAEQRRMQIIQAIHDYNNRPTISSRS